MRIAFSKRRWAAVGHRISGRYGYRLLRRQPTTHHRISGDRPPPIAPEGWSQIL